MMQPLLRLTYFSRTAPHGEADMTGTIAAILDASRRNNAAAGITGALMFDRGVFAQVLEGPAAEIERTFERIQRDERHCDVGVLELEPAEERAFPHWSMAYVGTSPESRALFAGIAEETGFDERRIEAREVFRVLRDLAGSGAAPAPSA
jgi:blue light- and temperature-responsive anti-repressor